MSKKTRPRRYQAARPSSKRQQEGMTARRIIAAAFAIFLAVAMLFMYVLDASMFAAN